MKNRLIVIAALFGLALSFVLMLGHTLSVIERRQQNEDEAIRCVLDAACLEHLRRHHSSAIPGELI